MLRCSAAFLYRSHLNHRAPALTGPNLRLADTLPDFWGFRLPESEGRTDGAIRIATEIGLPKGEGCLLTPDF